MCSRSTEKQQMLLEEARAAAQARARRRPEGPVRTSRKFKGGHSWSQQDFETLHTLRILNDLPFQSIGDVIGRSAQACRLKVCHAVAAAVARGGRGTTPTVEDFSAPRAKRRATAAAASQPGPQPDAASGSGPRPERDLSADLAPRHRSPPVYHTRGGNEVGHAWGPSEHAAPSPRAEHGPRFCPLLPSPPTSASSTTTPPAPPAEQTATFYDVKSLPLYVPPPPPIRNPTSTLERQENGGRHVRLPPLSGLDLLAAAAEFHSSARDAR